MIKQAVVAIDNLQRVTELNTRKEIYVSEISMGLKYNIIH
jgi:hypothetical protein